MQHPSLELWSIWMLKNAWVFLFFDRNTDRPLMGGIWYQHKHEAVISGFRLCGLYHLAVFIVLCVWADVCEQAIYKDWIGSPKNFVCVWRHGDMELIKRHRLDLIGTLRNKTLITNLSTAHLRKKATSLTDDVNTAGSAVSVFGSAL